MHEMYHLQDTFLAPFQAHLLIKKNNRKHDQEGTAYNPIVSPWVLKSLIKYAMGVGISAAFIVTYRYRSGMGSGSLPISCIPATSSADGHW